MHTGQLILVEARSAIEAIDSTSVALTSPEFLADWSNRHEAGGRWRDVFKGFSDHPLALQYSENPALADDLILEAVNHRLKELSECLSKITTQGMLDFASRFVEEYNPYDEFNLMTKTYDVRALLDIVSSKWSPNSYIYDMHESTTDLKYFKERLDDNPNNQYIVIVDFNY